ncbi:hypothetical protein D6764_01470 [Candidatus Woesearchaeota archaeon]|nr:MAG: hypothetical protein D6764_01470 [Candidatus Woesearchaeota archaeon]
MNEILWNNGEIAGIRSTEHDQEGKARALREICSREKIPVSETLFVGDHDNDVEIAKEAGFSVAFNAESKALIDVCDAVVEKKDLREVLKLFQGR